MRVLYRILCSHAWVEFNFWDNQPVGLVAGMRIGRFVCQNANQILSFLLIYDTTEILTRDILRIIFFYSIAILKGIYRLLSLVFDFRHFMNNCFRTSFSVTLWFVLPRVFPIATKPKTSILTTCTI